MTTPKRLFLIDGMAQIYRAHFAMIKNPLNLPSMDDVNIIIAENDDLGA